MSLAAKKAAGADRFRHPAWLFQLHCAAQRSGRNPSRFFPTHQEVGNGQVLEMINDLTVREMRLRLGSASVVKMTNSVKSLQWTCVNV